MRISRYILQRACFAIAFVNAALIAASFVLLMRDMTAYDRFDGIVQHSSTAASVCRVCELDVTTSCVQSSTAMTPCYALFVNVTYALKDGTPRTAIIATAHTTRTEAERELVGRYTAGAYVDVWRSRANHAVVAWQSPGLSWWLAALLVCSVLAFNLTSLCAVYASRLADDVVLPLARDATSLAWTK